jgi:hypothetical protein
MTVGEAIEWVQEFFRELLTVIQAYRSDVSHWFDQWWYFLKTGQLTDLTLGQAAFTLLMVMAIIFALGDLKDGIRLWRR